MKKGFNKVVLSINAHPDDAEAWNAGVLKLLRDKGYHIVIAAMTGGDLGGVGMDSAETARVRYEEARKAAAIIDADYYSLGGSDGFPFRHKGAEAEDYLTYKEGESGNNLHPSGKRLSF